MNRCVLALGCNILICMIHSESDAFRMLGGNFGACDTPAADLNILVLGNVFSASFQSSVPHVRVKSVNSFLTGNRTHLGDVPGGNRTDHIVGEIATLADGRSIDVAADTPCSTAYKTTKAGGFCF